MLSESIRRRFPAAAMYMAANDQSPNPSLSPSPGPSLSSSPFPTFTPPVLQRARRNTGERSPFNPVIVLRGPTSNLSTPEASDEPTTGGGFELYYDDGAGSGLRPLPASMSEFLLGSGFDRFLDQLSQIDANGFGRIDNNPPASKAAIESMPTIEIQENHISTESHCAVCKEPFDLGTEAKEMPCKHIYHSDCILPWLALRNSCPVCRHELPPDNQDSVSDSNRSQINDVNDNNNNTNNQQNNEEAVGLTIWRLPGGGFAVGRFSGGRRGERVVDSGECCIVFFHALMAAVEGLSRQVLGQILHRLPVGLHGGTELWDLRQTMGITRRVHRKWKMKNEDCKRIKSNGQMLYEFYFISLLTFIRNQNILSLEMLSKHITPSFVVHKQLFL
ncbi:hypothetical protein L1887_23570 [Cichorium endivia]|nr:hypothetical protein L1887_23570 [Cichorium endivia]